MLQMFKVTKIFEDTGVQALTDVNLRIREGEFVFLIGPSGAGKTTFMRLILREILPTSGHVLLERKNIAKLSMSVIPYLRRKIGMVFQDFKLLPNRTVYENVAFAQQVIGVPERDIRKRVLRALRAVKLTHRLAVKPPSLSAGEQQRVCIARAIVNKPMLLLSDEPTGNLDPEISCDIMQLLEQINAKQGTTVIVATHDKAFVDRMHKRVIALREGRVASDELEGVYAI